MKKLNKKGFTIVELVIVIAVIAILAAVLIPTFATVIDKANRSAAIQAAKNDYTEDLASFDGIYPLGKTVDDTYDGPDTDETADYQDLKGQIVFGADGAVAGYRTKTAVNGYFASYTPDGGWVTSTTTYVTANSTNQ